MDNPETPSPIRKISSQDLLTKASAPKMVRPPGFYKELVLDGLTVLLAGATGLAISLYVVDVLPLWAMLTCFGLWLSLSVALTAATQSVWRRLLVFLGEAGAIFMLAYSVSSEYFGAAIAIFLVLGIWGIRGSRSEFRNNLNLQLLRSGKPQISRTLTAFVFLVLILAVPHNMDSGEYLSDSIFRNVFGLATNAAHSLYPEIRFNMTLGDLAQDLARYKVEQLDYFKQLPEDVQADQLAQAGAQITDQLGKIVGQDLKPDITVETILHKTIYSALGALRKSYGTWFDLVWVILAFFVFRGLAILLGWAISLAAFFVYQFLVALGALTVRGEAQVQEVTVF